MKANEFITEKWSQKYKSSINCSHPKGFSQRAHCAGKKKHNEDITMEMVCEDCGMCKTHGNVMEIKKGQKDSNGYTRCWPGKHAEGTKKGKNGGQVRNCVPNESVNEAQQLSVQQLAQISDAALDAAYGYGRSSPGNTFGWQANLKSAAFAKQMIDRGVTDIEAISDAIHKGWNVTAQAFVKNPQMFDDSKTMAPEKLQAKIAQRQKLMTQQYAQLPEDEKEKDRVVARAMLQAIGGQQELNEEFDLIENIIHTLAKRNGVDAEAIWEDLESLSDDELYVFAVTTTVMESQGVAEGKIKLYTDPGYFGAEVDNYKASGPVVNISASQLVGFEPDAKMNQPKSKANVENIVAGLKQGDKLPPLLVRKYKNGYQVLDGHHRFWAYKLLGIKSIPAQIVPAEDIEEISKQEVAEDWQKANKKDRTAGMSQKAVNAYRRENPGSKLKTAVTTKPSKLKRGSKASKRRKSYCSRSRGQMKMHNISCAKTPDKAICKARRRWNC